MEFSESDFRIGNFVCYNDRIYKIVAISSPFLSKFGLSVSPIVVTDSYGEVFSLGFQDITPIPLDGDNLLLCNFEKINHIRGYIFYSYKRGVNSNECPLDIYLETGRTDVRGYMLSNRTYFLHQLQNLFFVINGKELVVIFN